MERPLRWVHHPLHCFKDITKDGGVPWSYYSRKERTSSRLYWKVQQRSCASTGCRRHNEAVPQCQTSARRHWREKDYPPRSPKDSQWVPSDRQDLHKIWRGAVRGQPQRIQEGGACCWILQEAFPWEKEGKARQLVKAKDPPVASPSTHPWPCPRKRSSSWSL